MYIKQTHSTNDLIKEKYLNENNLFAIRTGFQTNGKGQQGNSWHSQADKNLLCSILLKNPLIPIQKQFYLSMITSLAIIQSINLPNVCIKWPNDIYFQNKKLGGILIENAINHSHIEYSIIGIGLNINQTTWSNNVPNPISLKNITNKEHNIDAIFTNIQNFLMEKVNNFDEKEIKQSYMNHLFRKNGYHLYTQKQPDTSPNNPIFDHANQLTFKAKIIDVTDIGQIILEKENGNQQTYHFKQLIYIL